MSGQTDISSATTTTTAVINNTDTGIENVISSLTVTQTENAQAINENMSHSGQLSKIVAKPETPGKKPETLAKNMISGKLSIKKPGTPKKVTKGTLAKKPETPVKNMTAEDTAIMEDVHDTVESLVSTVSNQNPHPPSVVRISDDQKLPEGILRLINGKSPGEVVNIINGQLAELKAIETLRDVEEECLDELTSDIIAKITKDSIV